MKFAAVFVVCFLCLATQGFGQSDGEKKRVSVIPESRAVVSIVKQKDSPVVFEDVQLLTDELGSFPLILYRIRNRTSKRIAAVTLGFHQKSDIVKWQPFSDSWTETAGFKDRSSILVGANGIYENIRLSSYELRPFTNEIVENMRSNKAARNVFTFWIAFVRNVTFEDGTQFNSGELEEGLSDLFACDN
jgi:hypothetical protein